MDDHEQQGCLRESDSRRAASCSPPRSVHSGSALLTRGPVTLSRTGTEAVSAGKGPGRSALAREGPSGFANKDSGRHVGQMGSKGT